MYSFNSAWLNKSERRRMDAFQARCLRKIMNISHSYWSHVANRTVLERANQTPYSSQLLRHQILLFGKIGRTCDEDVLRKMTFVPGSVQSATTRLSRRPGRPRNEWAKCLHDRILTGFNTEEELLECLRDATQWKDFTLNFTSQ